MNKIPIVYITDDNYAMPTIVSIISLLKNKCKNTLPDVYVIGIDLSDKNRAYFKNIDNITLLNLENKYSDIKIKETYVSKAAFFKFDIAEIFRNHDKILYLDSDTLILDDLAEFFKTDLENLYAGVIKDCIGEIMCKDNERLKIKNYFNSGVMLLNAEKMREDNISEKLLENKKNSAIDYLDQEIFNITFKDSVKYLSPDYNYMVTNKRLTQKTVKDFYNVSKISPKIIHLTYLKPWEHENIPYSNEWMKYYNQSPVKKNKLNLKENPHKRKIYEKRKLYDRWIIDILGLRFSYKKGGKDFRLFYP